MEILKCPACGGAIKFIDNNEILFCPYCGTKMIKKQDALDKIIKHKEHMQEFKEEVRQRKNQETVETEKRNKKSIYKWIIGIVFAFIVLGIIVHFGIQGENNSENELKALVAEIEKDFETGNYDVALFKTEKLYWPHSDTDGKERWDKQREALKKVIIDTKESKHISTS